MSLIVKLELHFNSNLLFEGFLPETKDEGLHIRLRDGKYNATLYMSNRREQLDHVSDIPKDSEELKPYSALRCSGLTLEIEVTDPDPELLDAIEQSKITEKTEQFGREIFELVAWIHTRLVDYARNISKQTWLEPLLSEFGSFPQPPKYSDSMDSAQIFMNRWNASWLDSSGKWRRLEIGQQCVKVSASFTSGIDRETWKQLATFIEQGKRVPMRQVLLANSLQHANDGNSRLAVLEAVVALEAFIKQLLPKVILRLPGAPNIERKHLDRLLKDAGLRSITNVVFRIIKDPAGLQKEDINMIAEAVEKRNEIIHGALRELEPSKTWQYVSSIRRVCESFEAWAQL